MALDAIAPDHPCWVTLFIDVPAAAWDAAAACWTTVTGSTLSSRRGEDAEFAPLIPPAGDSCLRLEGLREGPAGVHPDLYEIDPEALADRAARLGASRIHDERGLHVLRSPAAGAAALRALAGHAGPRGLTYCLTGCDPDTGRVRNRA